MLKETSRKTESKKVAKAEAARKKIEKDSKDLEGKISSSASDKDNVIRKSEKDVQELQGQILKLNDNQVTFETTIAELKEQIENESSGREKAEKQRRSLANEIDELRAELDGTVDAEKLNASKKKYEDEINDLKKRLDAEIDSKRVVKKAVKPSRNNSLNSKTKLKTRTKNVPELRNLSRNGNASVE